MKYGNIKNLFELGYEYPVNVFEGEDSMELVKTEDYKNIMKYLAYSLNTDFFYSICFVEEDVAYSIVKIDETVYEATLLDKEEIMESIEHSYDCEEIAIFRIEGNKMITYNYYINKINWKNYWQRIP